MNLNELHALYVKDPLQVDAFAEALLTHVRKEVKTMCKRQPASEYALLEDAIGESLMKIWQNLDQFKGDALFSTFVGTIVRNCVADIIVNKRDRSESELVDNVHSDSPFRDIESRIAVKALLSKLSRDDREMVQMKLDGLSNEEVATAYDISVDAVKGRWKRLVKQLKP